LLIEFPQTALRGGQDRAIGRRRQRHSLESFAQFSVRLTSKFPGGAARQAKTLRRSMVAITPKPGFSAPVIGGVSLRRTRAAVAGAAQQDFFDRRLPSGSGIFPARIAKTSIVHNWQRSRPHTESATIGCVL
jgi:hypothetical protein